MKTNLKFLLPLLLLTACNGKQNVDKAPPPLNRQPQIIEVNPEGGYTLNIVTGDSIQDLILPNGDTLITGKSIYAPGKFFPSDSTPTPQTWSVDKPVLKNNPHSDELVTLSTKTVKINWDSLQRRELGDGDPTFVLLNSFGDTIPTGVPIKMVGEVTPAKRTSPIEIKSPRHPDNSIFNIRELKKEQGLLESGFVSVFKDSKNNIWFGSFSNCLTKYDGVRAVNYTPENGFTGNIIVQILEDRNGNIWTSSLDGGLHFFDGVNFTAHGEDIGIKGATNMLETSDGNIWVCHQDGIAKISNGYITHYTSKEGLFVYQPFGLVEDKNGSIWIGAWKGGLNNFDGKTFTTITPKDGLINQNTVIAKGNNNELWIASGWGGGICKFDGDEITQIVYGDDEGNINYEPVSSLYLDSDNVLWMGSRKGGGVVKMENGKFSKLTQKEGISTNVYSILESNSGDIWMATSDGIQIIGKNKSFFYNSVHGLTSSFSHDIAEGDNGEIYIASGSGLSILQDNKILNLTENEGLLFNSIVSLEYSDSGDLWIGHQGSKLSKYNGKEMTAYTTEHGLNDYFFSSLKKDRDGNIWATSISGLIKISNNGITRFGKHENVHTGKSAICSSVDLKNNVWVGTNNLGLIKITNDSLIYLTEKEGVISNQISSIHCSKNGLVWIGTENGLCVYDDKNFTYYTDKTGLGSNKARSIAEDDQGRIWVGLDVGYSVFIPSDSTKASQSKAHYQIHNLNTSDGFYGDGHSYGGMVIDSKNRIISAYDNGVSIFDLKSFDLPTKAPTTSIDQVYINGVFYDYSTHLSNPSSEFEYRAPEGFNNIPKKLVVPYNYNQFTFAYSAREWESQEYISYSYFLEGNDESWSTPTNKIEVDYKNLPFGEYTFHVKAISKSGKWSEPASFSFIIKRPWWHTWWARTGYAIIVIILIYAFVRSRTAKLKKRQLLLEADIAKATREIIEQKVEIEKAHIETQAQKEVIEEAHKEITDSINYAERIQRSFLATVELLNANLGEHFVYFNPKEAVSGDFYWAGLLANGNFAVSCADSTGHGVPGAIMSILNISSIELAVKENLSKPADIFNYARTEIIERLKKDGSAEGGKDGMDASLLSFNPDSTKMEFVAAHNPIWIIRNGELIDIKAEKMPVGKHDYDQVPFKGGAFDLQKGDIIYTMTDGFQDQFGGEKGKKFKVKPMKRMLLEICDLPMDQQLQKISDEFDQWKGNLEQVDDVCLIGIRV